MISRGTGETQFNDLRISPQGLLPATAYVQTRRLPLPGWSGHRLGRHHSDQGWFEVEAISDAEHRVQILLLAHSHPFYGAGAEGDAERRAFHEGIINSELTGQREFSWGEVLCRLDATANKDWLVLAFTPGPHVPRQSTDVLLGLSAYEDEPGDGTFRD